jgi:predicted FMN-binding regulatory protein PaiB
VKGRQRSFPIQLGSLKRCNDRVQAQQPDLEVADPPAVHGGLLRTIRVLDVGIEHVTAKFKYGDNLDIAHSEEIIARLERRAGPGDLAAASQARRRLEAWAKRPAVQGV